MYGQSIPVPVLYSCMKAMSIVFTFSLGKKSFCSLNDGVFDLFTECLKFIYKFCVMQHVWALCSI